ncbi:MAG: hypothetical protein WDM78_07290 [Puia sp.]
MQRNEGDLIKGIDRAYEEISYYQIGDNPGRNEPGTGEVNYKNIFKHLYNKDIRVCWAWNMAIPSPEKK